MGAGQGSVLRRLVAVLIGPALAVTGWTATAGSARADSAVFADRDGTGAVSRISTAPLTEDPLVPQTFASLPDASFANCVTDALDLAQGTLVTEAQVSLIEALDCSDRGIQSLAGAESLTSLGSLDLSRNQVSDLRPLSGLSHLAALVAPENQVVDVSPLTNLTELTWLSLDGNSVSDLALLRGATSLEYLWLDGNQIESVAPLANLTKLISLTLERNEISDLAPLAGLTNVTQLWLADNQIGSVRPLAALTKLTKLYLERNRLIDLTGVKSAFDCDYEGCGLYAADQTVSLPQATVGVAFPLVVKDDLGEVMPLTVPAGVTNANGALTYTAPGTYRIGFDVDWFSGTITQEARHAVTSATPKVTGSAVVGATLTTVPGAWGPDGVALAYQWFRGSAKIADATSATYVVQPGDVGASLKVQVTGTATDCVPVSKTSAATAVVVKGVLSPVVPKVSDTTPVTDQVLTADPGVWGPDPVTVAFQWYRVSSTGVSSSISGATQATYLVKSGDVGYRVKVKVTGSRPGYTGVSKYSALTSAVAKARFTTTPAPTIADVGTARVGKKLTAVPGEFVPVQSKFAYQWYRGATAITGATGVSYTLTSADKGQKVKVRVKAYRTGYSTVTQYTAPTVAVLAGLTAVTAKVSDTTPTVDQVLTANPGVWGPAAAGVTFGYQWYRGSTAIAGATESTYTVRPTDVGATIKVKVTGTAADYANVSKTSAATTAVVKANFTAKPVPAIGCADACLFRVGETLTAAAGDWQPVPDSLGYQWYRSGVAISGATQAGYTLTTTDKGKTMTVKVTARKAGYNTASKTSVASKAVVA